jgi:hypothetical protein
MVTSVYKWFLIYSLWFPVLGLGLNKSSEFTNKLNGFTHPYYISVVEINHNEKDKTLEISCKIFTNDFETTLEKNYKTKVNLVKPKDKAAMDKLINDYIKKHLSFKTDGRSADFFYLGFEKEDEAIYSFFQIDNVPALKKIEITNSILHDFSDQQINIIHCMVAGKRQSTKLDYPDTQASFTF